MLIRPTHQVSTRHAALGTLLAAAALAVVLVMPSVARASNLPYDRTDPVQTGCANNAYTVGSNNLFTPSGQLVGRVELRYSTTCHTNWARVISYVGSRQLLTFSVRVFDGVSTWGYGGDPGPFTGTSAYSDQLYGYNTTVCAYGAINGMTPWNRYCA